MLNASEFLEPLILNVSAFLRLGQKREVLMMLMALLLKFISASMVLLMSTDLFLWFLMNVRVVVDMVPILLMR